MSQAAVLSADTPKTMWFIGHIGGMDMLVLLDSGSSTSFISHRVASHLPNWTPLPASLRVQVANGSQLSCDHELTNVTWYLNEYAFSSNLKIIQLTHYDLILGMDWLSSHSPMWVHWEDKWLIIPYQGSTIKLCGMGVQDMQCTVMEVSSLESLTDKDQAIVHKLPAELQQLLTQYADIFEVPHGLPPPRECDHRISLLTGVSPVQLRSYRYAPALKSEIEKQVADMLQTGIIQNSSSAFSSPVILVKKKDNTYRFCVDYRHLNALTIKTKFPVPIIDEFLDELHGAAWFSTLDLRAGFHQICMASEDQHKTAFQTHHGHFEFKVMAFRLSGAPATFQGAMNRTLSPLLRKCALVFFDDILVYSHTWSDHIQHLELVFSLLRADQWQIKLSKCSFAQQEIAYLGHVISARGVTTDSSKVDAVTSWPVPANCRELRGFLGLAGYYRKFVRHFAVISKPLTQLLKKNTHFVWTQDHDHAFRTLKTALSSAPVLQLPDFSSPFAIETDTSGSGIGAVLSQNSHPLAFVSKALGPKNRGLSTYEKEYLAILMAVDHWRPYLLHDEFIIYTDQRSLSHLTEQKLNTPWQQKVFTKLLGLQYKILYKKGIENGAADSLSRRPHESSELYHISRSSPQWLSEIMDGYQQDNHAQQLLSELAVTASPAGHYTLQNGSSNTKVVSGWVLIQICSVRSSLHFMTVLWEGTLDFQLPTAGFINYLHGLT
jgi:hypothetical protein